MLATHKQRNSIEQAPRHGWREGQITRSSHMDDCATSSSSLFTLHLHNSIAHARTTSRTSRSHLGNGFLHTFTCHEHVAESSVRACATISKFMIGRVSGLPCLSDHKRSAGERPDALSKAVHKFQNASYVFERYAKFKRVSIAMKPQNLLPPTSTRCHLAIFDTRPANMRCRPHFGQHTCCDLFHPLGKEQRHHLELRWPRCLIMLKNS